jgi:hypothetical protein
MTRAKPPQLGADNGSPIQPRNHGNEEKYSDLLIKGDASKDGDVDMAGCTRRTG